MQFLQTQKKFIINVNHLQIMVPKIFRKANHNMIGINSRLDELQAYFLLEKLKKLKSDTSLRQKLAKNL